ncbi:MAG TPA: glycoside hydrolase family 3 C-terminal domain-containing protein [Acidobacteriaceae bacterium]|nr:glycoside hydrolase family 3 C-terminal domain-containing protein [Acidobacteriaceae bacterium]
MHRSAITLILFAAVTVSAQQHPWQDKTLSPDTRAGLVLKEMTLDEKIQLVHGSGWGVLFPDTVIPANSNLGAGFVPGIPRLGIPDINLADSAVGIRMAALQSRYATLLPSALGAAASWDTGAALLYGQVIGRELRAQGFNMSIGGGVDLLREPRNGRNFEYAGEDPLLAGTMVGTVEKGVATQHVMNDIKHYALNDQETGREILNAVLDQQAMRESDLLAFQIALEIAQPSGVMCAYNKVNGDYSCENDYLLNQVLKKDFGFQGFVLSDWTGTHSTVKAALAGLDMEQPGDFNSAKAFFGQPLEDAVLSGQVPQSRLDDMVHRILRSMFAAGVIDDPPIRTVVDPFRGRDDAQHIAEESIVLLRDQNNVLPLAPTIKSIAVIGGHADIGVLSGGGSAQVDAPGGNALDHAPGTAVWVHPVYFPSVPLREIAAHAPAARIAFNDGTDPAAAAAFAKTADVAIIFVTQFMHEEADAPNLSLPDDQDALVAAVAAANPRTIVVIESGGPVTMPWVDNVSGILEAWYPGIGGAQALANILFGAVNPSAKLPCTFPRTEADLPHPVLAGSTRVFPPGTGAGTKNQTQPFDVDYNIEGARVGYKWFDSENKQPLFPFGFGLSYTTFAYSDLKVDQSWDSVTLTVKNTGKRVGTEIAQLYVEPPANTGENYKRLAGWKRVTLAPGESQTITIMLDARTLSLNGGSMDPAGEYHLYAGSSSRDLPLQATVQH